MNSHKCSTDSSASDNTPSSHLPLRARGPSSSNVSPLDAPVAVYTVNLHGDEHLRKFSLAIDTKHRVLVCQLHQVIINSTIQAITNHIKHHSHITSGFPLSIPSISAVLKHWHIQTKTPQQPVHEVVPISGIKPPDGYQCSVCSYAVCASEAARRHTDLSRGHQMEPGQVQRVQRVYWKVLPREEWETSNPVCLAPEAVAQICKVTNSLMNPQSMGNETDVFVVSPCVILNLHLIPCLIRHISQFLKDTGLCHAYKHCNTEALVTLATLQEKDPLSKAMGDVSLHFCKRTIVNDIPTLSMLTRTRINSGQVHVGDNCGDEFWPQNHKESTVSQYSWVLASLGLFLVHGCITHAKGQDYHISLDFFNDCQRNAAVRLHRAVATYIEDMGSRESADSAAEALYELALSVLFTPLHTLGNSSWSTTCRQFFSISALSPKPNYRCHEPSMIAIWLSSLKFCMKIIACHKVRCDYLAQQNTSGVSPSTALRDDESVSLPTCALM